jgi:antitoxin (DNA-binding transcriptional repressor) of toxin-antitoxin stability system
MNVVSVREFRKNLSKYLKEGCDVVTRGKTIAQVIPVINVDKIKYGVPKIDKEYIDIARELNPDGFKVSRELKDGAFDKAITEKKIKLCKHGAAIGNCKFGCKK